MATRRRFVQLAAASMAMTAAGALPPVGGGRIYQARRDFGAPLEPKGRILHGAGQDIAGYTDYCRILPATRRPALYMSYTGITLPLAQIEAWGRQTSAELSSITDHTPGLQIGLWLTGEGKPLDDRVAAGEFDAQITGFAEALKALNRPALVRIGYEFDGPWNGYRAGSFRQSWRKIATELFNRRLPVALVWCSAAGAAGWSNLDQAMAFYPGDEWVHWWGIDLFDAAFLSDARTFAFLDAARQHGKPVLIGESTAKGIGTRRGIESWNGWFEPYFSLIAARPEIKGFCYINWDWPTWAKRYGFPWADWGDARIEQNEVVRELWRRELANDIFQCGSVERAGG